MRATSHPFGNKTGGLGQFGDVPVPAARPAALATLAADPRLATD